MAARPIQDARVLSHGRGGAGNIAKNDPTTGQPNAEDLVTPTLKGNTYTTGRGGTGNMAQNNLDRPEIARAAQDVDAPSPAADLKGPTHYGRGGAANIADKDGQRKSADLKRKSEDIKREEGAAKGGLVAKGKGLLNKLKK